MVKGMEDRLFNSIIYIILGSVAIVALFPLLYVFAVSITPMERFLKTGATSSFLEALHWKHTGSYYLRRRFRALSG